MEEKVKKLKCCYSLSKDIVDEMDRLRGLVPRSTYLESRLREVFKLSVR